MSDLTATNCGCNDSCGCANAQNYNGLGSCGWLILLLLFCGGNGGVFSNNNGCGCGNGSPFSGGGCECIIWLLLLSAFCGGNGFFGGNGYSNNGCGC